MNFKCAILLLAAYDFESLQLTLLGLDHTIENVPIIVVLNGKRNFDSYKVESVARKWAENDSQNRFVVCPKYKGGVPLFAIQEIIEEFDILKKVDLICKIDDDVIPVRKNWLNHLIKEYKERYEKNEKIGFITGLINNNCWGFKELVFLADKVDEYKKIMSYQLVNGEIDPNTIIDDNFEGTVWKYPYLARWIHQWTTLSLDDFVKRTSKLSSKEIPLDIHYSIGCILSNKMLWKRINGKENIFDEGLIHSYCKENNLRKIAVRSAPMIHLSYAVQKTIISDMMDDFLNSFSQYFQDERFKNIYRKNFESKFSKIELEISQIKEDIEAGRCIQYYLQRKKRKLLRKILAWFK